MDAVHGQRFVRLQWRKEPHHRVGEHGLSRSRGTDHADVVPSGCREGHGLEAPLLTADGAEFKDARAEACPAILFGEVAASAGRTGPRNMLNDLSQMAGTVAR